MELLSYVVAAGNPKHTGTVSSGSSHNIDTYDGARLNFRATGGTVAVSSFTTVRATVTTTTPTATSRASGATSLISRVLEGNCRVDHSISDNVDFLVCL
jgi:hypothetical protein